MSPKNQRNQESEIGGQTLSLNAEQQKIFDLVVNEKQSIFLTAIAGSGKTYLVKEIDRAMRAKGYRIISVAFTGKAATLLRGGTTVSRCVQMLRGEEDVLPEGVIEAQAWNGTVRTPLRQVYSNADPAWACPNLLVIVDEVAQLSSEKARLFYDIGMKLRRSKSIHKPPIFIFAGDFGQFQCINGSLIWEPARYEYWKTVSEKAVHILPSVIDEVKPVPVQLTQVMRQSEAVYLRALRWAYYGVALHPVFVERLRQTPPSNTPRVFYNNKEVVAENRLYLERFAEENPRARSREYEYLGDRLSQSELNHLLPVQPSMRVYEGSSFTITVNVPDPNDPKKLIAANGEVVTVHRLMSRAIEVRKKDGTVITLNPVEHPLPADQKGKTSRFCQLPGYPGPNSSLMKVQGETFEHPVIYAAWQWKRGQRVPLNEHGSIYVAASRNTKLEDIYFDTSFGIEEAEKLLRQSICVNPAIKKYLMQKKPYFYLVDSNRKHWVYEIVHCEEKENQTYQLGILYTCIRTGQEILYSALCQFRDSGADILQVEAVTDLSVSQPLNSDSQVAIQKLLDTVVSYYT
ncbi:AAA family ATPase [Leptolyngbya sp. AN03gr2]|uniref:AAA family ATPase n=1 Tax=Leptolyngbya sp. AN03gr2 TaxID=3423364 RepID=UPI003D31C307